MKNNLFCIKLFFHIHSMIRKFYFSIRIFFLSVFNKCKWTLLALDPAGPLFYIFNAHLTNSDAKFVDVIHTDMGILGLAKEIGHVDFYVNYGVRPQPGCTSTNLILFLIGLYKTHSS